MASLKNYPTEFASPFNLSFFMLKICNIHIMDENIVYIKKFKFTFMIGSLCLFHGCVVLSLFNSLLFVGANNSGPNLAAVIPGVMICSEAIFKGIIIFCNKKEIESMVNSLGSMWRTANLTERHLEKRKVMLRNVKIFQRGIAFASLFDLTLSIGGLVVEAVLNIVTKQGKNKILPSPIYPFKEPSNWITYIFVFAFQTFNMYMMEFLYLAPEFLLNTLCSHLVTEFAFLREDWMCMTLNNPESDLADYDDRFKAFVKEFTKKHQKLTRLSVQLDAIFNKIIFMILLFVTIIVCFFAFAAEIASDATTKVVNYVGAVQFLAHPLILSHYAALLKEESGGLAEAVYHSLWYNCDKRNKSSVCFIIMRSQKECCLTSFGYAPVSLEPFTMVLSTTWSYLSLIRGLYKGN